MVAPLIDDCARCGVPVREHGLIAVNKDGRRLVLCGHHGHEHEPALKHQGWAVVDVATIEREPSKAAQA